MKRIVSIGLFFAILLMTGCKADISAYGEAEIQVIGLTAENFAVTPNELAEMDCVSATAKGTTAKSGEVEAYGPTLESFVETYGHTLSEMKCVRMTASDGYDVVIGPLTWNKYDVILSIANGSEALNEQQQPMRIVIPGGASGNWERMVIKMEFTLLEE